MDNNNNFFDVSEFENEHKAEKLILFHLKNLKDELKKYYNKQNLDITLETLKSVYSNAKDGDTESMFGFGNLLWEPIELNAINRDYYEEIAIYWVKKAAFYDHPLALSMIGSFLFTGNSKLISKDPEKGELVLERSIALLSDDKALQSEIQELLILRKSELNNEYSEEILKDKEIPTEGIQDTIDENINLFRSLYGMRPGDADIIERGKGNFQNLSEDEQRHYLEALARENKENFFNKSPEEREKQMEKINNFDFDEYEKKYKEGVYFRRIIFIGIIVIIIAIINL